MAADYSSSLSNPDLAPTTAAQRTWSTWHIAALWIGMAVCITTYTIAAGMIEQGMNWWQATLTVALGNVIVLIPMILNGHPGAKYGIPFPVLMRASFGTRGANIPALARAVVACGWFGIQTWVGGEAIYQILGAMHWIDLSVEPSRVIAWLHLTPIQFVCFMAFWLINLHFVWHGMESIKWMESWAAPFLIGAGLALMIWALWKVSRVQPVSVLFARESKFTSNGAFWAVFVPNLTAMVGYWATLSLNIPDFTRYAKDQKSQAWGQVLGLPTTMTLFCFIGIVVTSATFVLYKQYVWNPVEVVTKLGSIPVIVIALIALTVATLSTNIAANVVSPANDFANLNPRRISFRTGGMITAFIGVIMMPWYLYNNLSAYIFTWLIGYSALLGPIAGIMLCDYYLIRRKELNVRALYEERGEYSYTNGFNWIAVATMVLAVLPNVPGFLNAATNRTHAQALAKEGVTPLFPKFFDDIYGYAWFIGLALAMAIYFVLMAGRVKKSDRAQASDPTLG